MSAANGRNDTDEHIGELAELYALGVLEPEERGPVDAHVAVCALCARALGAAESTIAALDETFIPQLEPPGRLGSRIAASAQTVTAPAPRREQPRASRTARPAAGFLATAAALLLAAGIGGGVLVERSADGRQAARDSAILATIASSHFNHASLTPRDPAAPVSKVLYARDGAWYYVVVDSATCACRVVASTASGERDLGEPEVRGSTATLFVRNLPRPRSLELVGASGRIISGARLVYPAQ
jgi:anti-sigma factor RsiW